MNTSKIPSYPLLLAVICAATAVQHIQAVLVHSALIKHNGASIILWGDSHTHIPTDVDRTQIDLMTGSLANKYDTDGRRLTVLVEETPWITKIINRHHYNNAPLVLSGIVDSIKTLSPSRSISTQGIEMRGVANACCYILAQNKNGLPRKRLYNDAHNTYRLNTLTVDTLQQSFRALYRQCTDAIATKEAAAQRPWFPLLSRAKQQFEILESYLKPYDSKTDIFAVEESLDSETSVFMYFHIIESFIPLFDMLVAEKILKLTEQGQDVALCAGFFHTQNIYDLLMKHTDTESVIRPTQHPTPAHPLDQEQIDLFTQPAPSSWMTFLRKLCP